MPAPTRPQAATCPLSASVKAPEPAGDGATGGAVAVDPAFVERAPPAPPPPVRRCAPSAPREATRCHRRPLRFPRTGGRHRPRRPPSSNPRPRPPRKSRTGASSQAPPGARSAANLAARPRSSHDSLLPQEEGLPVAAGRKAWNVVSACEDRWICPPFSTWTVFPRMQGRRHFGAGHGRPAHQSSGRKAVAADLSARAPARWR